MENEITIKFVLISKDMTKSNAVWKKGERHQVWITPNQDISQNSVIVLHGYITKDEVDKE